MANVKTSAESAASTLDGTELVRGVQGGSNVKITADQFLKIAAGTVTADAPVINLSQTWNNGSVAFTGWKLDITNTAHANGSLWLNITSGANAVLQAGQVQGSQYGLLWGSAATGQYAYCSFTGADWFIGSSEDRTFWFGNTTAGIIIGAVSGGPGVGIRHETNYTLGFRTGTNPITHRIYNTFTDASNYERLSIGWASNLLTITTEKAGTGSNRDMVIGPGGLQTLYLAVNGAAQLTISSGAVAASGGAGVKLESKTVAALPSASGNTGMMFMVTDATATTFWSTVSGGGSNTVKVTSDGTNWKIG